MTASFPDFWNGKRYYSLDAYLKHTYGEKMYKLSLNGGMTCPNRDGTLGTRGCIFAAREAAVILPLPPPLLFPHSL